MILPLTLETYIFLPFYNGNILAWTFKVKYRTRCSEWRVLTTHNSPPHISTTRLFVWLNQSSRHWHLRLLARVSWIYFYLISPQLTCFSYFYHTHKKNILLIQNSHNHQSTNFIKISYHHVYLIFTHLVTLITGQNWVGGNDEA